MSGFTQFIVEGDAYPAPHRHWWERCNCMWCVRCAHYVHLEGGRRAVSQLVTCVTGPAHHKSFSIFPFIYGPRTEAETRIARL
jgi:hypothetical protein